MQTNFFFCINTKNADKTRNKTTNDQRENNKFIIPNRRKIHRVYNYYFSMGKKQIQQHFEQFSMSTLYGLRHVRSASLQSFIACFFLIVISIR